MAEAGTTGVVRVERENRFLVVGLVGRAGAGKDSAALALIERGWVKVAFADALREWMAPLVGRTPEELQRPEVKASECPRFPGYTYRQLLQKGGTDWVRDLNVHYWVEEAVRRIEAAKYGGARGVVVTDCRYPEEAESVLSFEGGILVGITRPGNLLKVPHLSEEFVDSLMETRCKRRIENSGGIDSLQRSLLEIVEAELGETL